ncbi:hypothetical protein WH7805_12808 [Synechococcus sp. WH 7805]|nr:hypothetical protein WH7805_12808 [Synechococcus sp. WH 7805]
MRGEARRLVDYGEANGRSQQAGRDSAST